MNLSYPVKHALDALRQSRDEQIDKLTRIMHEGATPSVRQLNQMVSDMHVGVAFLLLAVDRDNNEHG